MGVPEIRTYRPGDEVAINEAFNRVFGRQRTLAEWAWKFSAPEALKATLAAWDGSALSAHNGATPAVFQIAGRRVQALQGVDTFSLAALARKREWKSAWLHVMDAFAEVASQAGVGLLYGFTGPRSISHMVARCRWDSAPPRRIPLLERETRSTGRTLASRLYVARLAGDDEPVLDDLWARVAHRYPAAIVRDSEHALHRFSHHPTVRYHRWIVYRRLSTVPVAFVVFRTDGGVCHWADLLWDSHHPGALDLIDHLAKQTVAQTGAAREALWIDGDPEVESRLRHVGFEGGPDPSGVVRVIRLIDTELNPELFSPGKVYTTMADADLV